MKLGFHASHEQFTPQHLLKLVQQAEKVGFQCVLSSDHFHPWSNNQGESGFAWSWLGAAMQATSLEFGIVNAPGQRYHPAIIAQAVATLDAMFPDRFWIAAGSGQAVNESITGEKWPSKEERNERLKESVKIMRKLWQEDEYISHKGLIKIENAKLFTKPTYPPTVYGAALTEKTAKWIADWADGMITISKPLDELEKLVKAFREYGNTKPMALKVQISYAPSEEEALEGAWHQWKNNIFPSKLLSNIETPDQFDTIGEKVRKDDMREHVIIGHKAELFIEKIRIFQKMGFEKIIIHNVNDEQEQFIDFFGKEVIPGLKQAY